MSRNIEWNMSSQQNRLTEYVVEFQDWEEMKTYIEIYHHFTDFICLDALVFKKYKSAYFKT